MRDMTVIQEFGRIRQFIGQLQQSFQLAITGEALQNKALINLLIEKKILSETELTQAIGKVIQEANAAAAPKESTLVQPTPEEVAQINANVSDAPATPEASA